MAKPLLFWSLFRWAVLLHALLMQSLLGLTNLLLQLGARPGFCAPYRYRFAYLSVAHRCVAFCTDNGAIVDIINRQTSKHPLLILVRNGLSRSAYSRRS